VLPRIGRVATKEATDKFRGRILSATCRREADRWYVAVTVEVERGDPVPVQGPVVGVDRGIMVFAICSDGSTIDGPRALSRSFRRLQHRSRAVSRKQPGSANRRKSTLALAGCTAVFATSGWMRYTRPPRHWRKPSRSSWWRTFM
jgi:putative transposase